MCMCGKSLFHRAVGGVSGNIPGGSSHLSDPLFVERY